MTKKSRVGINTLFCIPGKVGGTEVFLREHINQLKKDNKSEYVIFLNNENKNAFGKFLDNIKLVVCPFNADNKIIRVLWEQFVLPFQCVYYRIDIVHSPGYTSPIFTLCKRITTIFDLNYHFHPEDFSMMQLSVYKILIPLVAKFSDKIVTHSFNSKNEISKVLGVSKSKVVVIYPGLDSGFKVKHKIQKTISILSKYKIKIPYLLASSVSYPHKNISPLLIAYSILVHKYKIKQSLVLLGFPGRDEENLKLIVNSENIEDRVLFTGWVPPEYSPYFYEGAEIFLFPSLYEGFGLPLIESMSVGVPLVASNASCIPEVVRNGGLLIDCKSPEKIAATIMRVLNNKKIKKALVLKGRIRAKYFSWTKFGNEIKSLYTTMIL